MRAIRRQITGALKEFTKAYRRHRLAAAEARRGFMTFKVAEQRLRSNIIALDAIGNWQLYSC